MSSGQVKNRAPAQIQITSEQLLRESHESQLQQFHKTPDIKIHDAEEYQAYLLGRRKQFEDNIRYRREHIGGWVKYAKFEETNKELERARSIYERSLEVCHTSGELWLRYAEFEMRNECINHARNVLDRAVTILPRISFLWFKYVYMEEMVGDIPKCRAVFERWMEWLPEDGAWLSYARFELRSGFAHKAEEVFERFVQTYPCVKSFLKYSKFLEYELQDVQKARVNYESMLEELEEDEILENPKVFSSFARFEERHGEYERARMIYRHAVNLFGLDRLEDEVTNDENDWIIMKDDDEVVLKNKLIKSKRELYTQYASFEKKHGDRRGIEDLLVTQKSKDYELRIKNDPLDYDAYLQYAKLLGDSAPDEDDHQMDGNGNNKGLAEQIRNKVRDIYERAIAALPPVEEKKFYKRYLYVWINYAIYEELTNNDIKRAIAVYDACLNLIPHSKFTFTKIWIYAAKAHIRNKDMESARKLLGRAIGVLGHHKHHQDTQKNKSFEKLMEAYIEIELGLGEVDRCRKLYEKYLTLMPYSGSAWKKYAGLESNLGEIDRCRAIFELAVNCDHDLDMPEMVWKDYIDFEIGENEFTNARKLYERLLEKTQHVKVWISYAQFESSCNNIETARDIFKKADGILKETSLHDHQNLNNKEERVLLLDAWRVFEKSKGTSVEVQQVEDKMPKRIKKRRQIAGASGDEWEEYFDYHFPDDADGAAAANLKILEMAQQWKTGGGDDDSSDDSSSEEEEA